MTTRPLMNITEEMVEEVRQVLSETHENNRVVKITAKEVAILLTVCTEWLRISEAMGQECTHRCSLCCHQYTPAVNESEDCPKCGSNGKGN